MFGLPAVNLTAFVPTTKNERRTSHGCMHLAFSLLYDVDVELCKYCVRGSNHYMNLLIFYAQLSLGRTLKICLAQTPLMNHSSLPKTLFAYMYKELPITIGLAVFLSKFWTEKEITRIISSSVSCYLNPLVTQRKKQSKKKAFRKLKTKFCFCFCCLFILFF